MQLIKQILKYSRNGFGIFGCILKHSLVPNQLFDRVLPNSGLILDLGVVMESLPIQSHLFVKIVEF